MSYLPWCDRERDELGDEMGGLKQRQIELEARDAIARDELDKLTKEVNPFVKWV